MILQNELVLEAIFSATLTKTVFFSEQFHAKLEKKIKNLFRFNFLKIAIVNYVYLSNVIRVCTVFFITPRKVNNTNSKKFFFSDFTCSLYKTKLPVFEEISQRNPQPQVSYKSILVKKIC